MVDGASLSIVYFGTPAFAVPPLEALIASRHRVAAVVSQPDRPRGRGQRVLPTPTKEVAGTRTIPVLQPQRVRDEAFLEAVRALSPDLGVVAAFGRILPDALLAIPRLGMINVHASLLPAYRGAAPVARAILAGDDETGVTIMRVVHELDAGPTFAARAVPIAPDATTGALEAVLAGVGAELLVAVVEQISAGQAVETPQNESQATYAAKMTKEEGAIDWSRPARTVHDLIRAAQPWPLASTTVTAGVAGASNRFVIRQSAFGEGRTQEPPGTIVRAAGDDLLVACGGGSVLRILEIQPDGRRTMTAREFMAGRRLTAGDRFGA
ncbi:MAG TPA: methionyl-tRNA formyltransferase [Vicinamibacterales bacterium]|nr:methionyl-tRNA formyltransferase [Vicinamibacterales bacterium]